MKYCLKCGSIYAESYKNYERDTCIDEGFPLKEDPDMTEEKFLQLSEEEKDAYELHILDLCRKSGHFDEKRCQRGKHYDYYYGFRFDKFEQLSGKKAPIKLSPEEQAIREWEIKQGIRESVERYTGTSSSSGGVQCPYCKSTNTRKISTTAKAANTALFGIFGTKRYKQWHCNKCGSNF